VILGITLLSHIQSVITQLFLHGHVHVHFEKWEKWRKLFFFSSVQSQLDTVNKNNTTSHTLFSVVATTPQKQGRIISTNQKVLGGKRVWEECFKEDLLVMMIDYFDYYPFNL